MSIPGFLILCCFVVLMLSGIFVLIYSIVRLTRRDTSPSQLSLPGVKIELKGPAWLLSAVIGAVMLASPIIAAEFQKPANVTVPPPPSSVQSVRSIPDPTYESFRFIRDVSLLDLRSVTAAPWYASIPGWQLIGGGGRIKPAVLKNYMVVRKVAPANEIHLTYGTSGKLDVRCLTHQARLRKAPNMSEDKAVGETWEVIADVSAVPVGQEFEIAVEATFWNGFSGEQGDDYTTYGHKQTEPEDISVMLLFTDGKPFKNVGVTEYGPDSTEGTPFQGQQRAWPGPENQTYYWSTTSQRPEWYYKLSWTW
jgi:hypothetical protein